MKTMSSAQSGRRSGQGKVVAVIVALMLVGLSACASPSARIKRNQELFNGLAPTEQALIREGKVAVGFTQDMVRLAVGDPDQRWVRTNAQGRSEIWSYSTYDTNLGSPLYRGYYHRTFGGYPLYGDVLYSGDARAREIFKVAFVEGKVAEIEQESR